MTDLQLLLQFRVEALGAVYGSTACEPVRAALGAFVDAHLEAAAGRAAAAQQRSQERSQAVSAGIILAAGALPTSALVARGAAGHVQRRIANRKPEFYSLHRVPDIETVRAALLKEWQQRKERASVLEPAKGPIFGSTL